MDNVSFTKDVGQRIKASRKGLSISRRILSERSGVSQRYLAQLEAGEGNISINLLAKVSDALGQSPDWFLRAPFEDKSEQRLLRLYRSSAPHKRDEILRLLEAGSESPRKSKRICLIGLRGAGKSTLGARLAAKIGYEFLELNSVIEEQSGMAVAELIALYGQEGYRQIERNALERVVNEREDVVLAVGGGVVSDAETFAKLLSHFHSVWLKATPEEHMNRVREQGDVRPMAGNPSAMDELKSILRARELDYARADHVVDTSGRNEDDSLNDLFEYLTSLNLT